MFKTALVKSSMLLFLLCLLSACEKDSANGPSITGVNFCQEMRDFVQRISVYGKTINEQFAIIPQNGQELVTIDGEPEGDLASEYLTAIDGVGREDLFYGYDDDNKATNTNDKNWLMAFCDLCVENGVTVLTTDYCSSYDKMDNSYQQNLAKGYISFAAPARDLNVIPDYPAQPFNVNKNDISHLSDMKNFLYLLDPERFSNKQKFITAIAATNYDLIIMDYFFDDIPFSVDEIAQLKTKQNGGKRLVVSYMSIGEAEDYRYYWQSDWKKNKPVWLEAENPDWEGNYKVRYWEKEWQDIILGSENSYLDKIIGSGFDGVYLDIIDAFEYFE